MEEKAANVPDSSISRFRGSEYSRQRQQRTKRIKLHHETIMVMNPRGTRIKHNVDPALIPFPECIDTREAKQHGQKDLSIANTSLELRLHVARVNVFSPLEQHFACKGVYPLRGGDAFPAFAFDRIFRHPGRIHSISAASAHIARNGDILQRQLMNGNLLHARQVHVLHNDHRCVSALASALNIL